MDRRARPAAKSGRRRPKVPENDDDPRDIAYTRQYLLDFNRLDAKTTTARELYDAMLELYPDRVNPGSLWRGAQAAKAGPRGPAHAAAT